MKLTPAERAMRAIVRYDCTANPSAMLAAIHDLDQAGDYEAAAAALSFWSATEQLQAAA